MSPYAYSDYRRYLVDIIKRSGARGTKSALAQAAGCQRSHFSQVLAGTVNLSLEHAIGLAQYLRLNPLETEFLYCLVALARAGNKELRHYYESRMRHLRWASEATTKNEQPKSPLSDTHLVSEYYSSWKFAAIHIAVTIPEMQTLAHLTKRLGLDSREVELILEKLEAWGLIEKKVGGWQASRRNIHLPTDHFMAWSNHRGWRARALEVAEARPERGTNYTAVYSMSREDVERLREMVARFIAETRELVVASQEEELVCFTLDCVRIS